VEVIEFRLRVTRNPRLTVGEQTYKTIVGSPDRILVILSVSSVIKPFLLDIRDIFFQRSDDALQFA
jgi:hypothetical protein